jgi:hypothetical protein
MKRKAAFLAIALLALLHQDFWFWNSRHLVFGFLPVGLAYHAGFSMAASLAMWMLVRHAWPSHLEEEVEQEHSATGEGD